jgi:hypothetical protein
MMQKYGIMILISRKHIKSFKYYKSILCDIRRHLMGQELSDLSIKDLQYFENILEMSLKGIRMRKV